MKIKYIQDQFGDKIVDKIESLEKEHQIIDIKIKIIDNSLWSVLVTYK